MTREEAIKFGKRVLSLSLFGETHEFCELAVKALEQQPCEDAISRSDAIRVASGYCHWSNIPKELAKLPSLNTIPCEDAISRQAAIDAMYELCNTGETLKENPWRDNPHIDAITDAINDLPSVNPQEPCDDVISRKQTLEAFGLSEKTRKYGGDHSGYETMTLYEIQDVIEGLPSVSTEKTGHWRHYEGMLICAKCGAEFYDDIMEYCGDDVPKCCPDCGAKMQEV